MSHPNPSKPSSLFRQRLRELLYHGGPGFAQFAITSHCNARCHFCNFALGRVPPSQRRAVPLERALGALDILRRQGIRYIVFVGGEPLMHPGLNTMVAHAASNDMHPMICTNGALLKPQTLRDLKQCGLHSILISIDAADAKRHEDNRGLPGVCTTIAQANHECRHLGIPTTASVTISRLIPDYHALLRFVRHLGFRSLTFSYPLKVLGSSYLSYSDSDLVDFTAAELIQIFEKIKRLKKHFCIANPTHSLSDMQRFLKKQKALFPCLAGYKYFFLDWDGMLYRCHFWKRPMCAIEEFDGSQLVRDGCTRCMIDCYRDPSVLQHIAVAIADSFGWLRHGHLWRAAAALINYRTFASLQAVVEDLRWIRQF